MRWVGAVVLWFCSCWTLGAQAQATVPGLELHWRVDPPASACPPHETVEAMVERALGPSARARDSREPVLVHVAIRPNPEGSPAHFAVHMTIAAADQHAERSFAGEDCGRVTEAVSLIIAMALDPLSFSASRSHARTRSSSAPPAPKLSLGVRITGDVGSLPEPTVGAAARMGLQYGRSALELDATYWLPRLALGVPTPDSGGEISLLSGALRVLYEAVDLRSSQLRIGPCVGAELGRSSGRGVQVEEPTRSSGLWVLAWAGLALRQTPAAGLATDFSLEFGIPIRRPLYVVDGVSRAFQASPLIVRASLGVRWIF